MCPEETRHRLLFNLSCPFFQVVDFSSGAFNTPVFRLVALVAVGLLQAYLMLNFITFHLRRRRMEKTGYSSLSAGGVTTRSAKKTQQEKAQKRKEQKERESELTEVDQNTRKSLRQRK